MLHSSIFFTHIICDYIFTHTNNYIVVKEGIIIVIFEMSIKSTHYSLKMNKSIVLK